MAVFETPELAATNKDQRLAAVAVDFDESRSRATVLVLAHTGDLMVRYCVLGDEGWVRSDRDPASSADLAWSSEFASNDPEPVLTFATHVPDGVTHVVVRFAGIQRRVEVSNGYLIASWWGSEADPDADPPEVEFPAH